MLEARESVRNLPTYHPPLGGREGLRLDFNENTVGCSPRVLARLREMTAEEIACYPEREPIEAVVSDFLGINPDELLLTNGVDEAIHLLCETFLQAGDEALIVVPTFAMYEIFAAATGARVITVPADADFQFPTADLLSQVTPRTRLIAVANPNNPTGTVAEADTLLEIASRIPQAAILVDEAYFDFYGKTLIRQWRDAPNLFVARTFSKAYGLAGLRAGVLTGNVGTHLDGEQSHLPLQREWDGARLPIDGTGRSGLRSAVRRPSSPGAGRTPARVRPLGNSILAESGKFCACELRSIEDCNDAVDASAWDFGTRPLPGLWL